MTGSEPKRPLRAVWPLAILGLAAAILGGLFLLASSTKTPSEEAADTAPPARSSITVPVEQGALVDDTTLKCVAESAQMSSALLSAPVGYTSAVVTAMPIAPGSTVQEGRPVLEVNGLPVFAVNGPLPPYRDLLAGDSGPDVEQLQRMLGRQGLFPFAIDGVVGPATIAGVRELYQANGYPPPPGTSRDLVDTATAASEGTGEPGDDRGERPATGTSEPSGPVWPSSGWVSVSIPGATVRFPSMTVGSDIAEGSITFESPQSIVTCQPPTGATDLEGSSGTAQVSGRRLRFEFTSLRADGSIVVSSTAASAEQVRPGTRLKIRFRHRLSDEQDLLVPVAAVWTSNSGDETVSVKTSNGFQDVAIQIVASLNGQVAVRASDGLSTSSEVRISQ